MNFHICIKINGHVTKNAAKKDTFKYVKKVSWRAVKINLLSEPSFLTAFAKGSTKKPYKCSAKKYINNIQNEVSNIDIEDNHIEKKENKKDE